MSSAQFPQAGLSIHNPHRNDPQQLRRPLQTFNCKELQLKSLKLSQFWKGQSTFICSGHLHIGPRCHYLQNIGFYLLTISFACIHLIGVLPSLSTEQNGSGLAVIYMISLFLVIVVSLITQTTGPGFIPRRSMLVNVEVMKSISQEYLSTNPTVKGLPNAHQVTPKCLGESKKIESLANSQITQTTKSNNPFSDVSQVSVTSSTFFQIRQKQTKMKNSSQSCSQKQTPGEVQLVPIELRDQRQKFDLHIPIHDDNQQRRSMEYLSQNPQEIAGGKLILSFLNQKVNATRSNTCSQANETGVSITVPPLPQLPFQRLYTPQQMQRTNVRVDGPLSQANAVTTSRANNTDNANGNLETNRWNQFAHATEITQEGNEQKSDRQLITENNHEQHQHVEIVQSQRNESKQGECPRVFCRTCEIYRPDRASHCTYCDACVESFDHHCSFLNVCIGRMNYRYYFSFLTIIFVALLIHNFIEVTYIIRFLEPQITQSFEDFLLWANIFYLIISLALFFYSTYLLGYHINLRFKSLTTKEFLKNKRIQPTSSKSSSNLAEPFNWCGGKPSVFEPSLSISSAEAARLRQDK